MNPDEDKAVAAQASAGPPLHSYDAREIEKASNYAAKKENEVQMLYDDFDKMGLLRRIWDSKVPAKNKRFYYFFTFCPTDREGALVEIRKYLDFYKDLLSVINSVSGSGEARPDSGDVNPYTLILDVNEKLTKLHKAAKSGKECTGSSAVYELHRSFMDKHKKLESMIKRVECVVLKEGLKKATDGWQESLQAISILSEDLKGTEEKYDQMCERFDRLLLQNETLLEQQTILMENNRRLEQQQEILLQENAAVRSILKSIASNGLPNVKAKEEISGGHNNGPVVK